MQEKILNFWEDHSIEKIIQDKERKYVKQFILHLGPPYATGDLHKGHLLNYIIKMGTRATKGVYAYQINLTEENKIGAGTFAEVYKIYSNDQ